MRTDLRPALPLLALLALTSCGGVNGGVRLEAPPPAPPAHVEPHPGYVFVAGHWDRADATWVWREGYWVPQRPGYVWVDGIWNDAGGYWRWQPGHWAAVRDSATNDHPGL